MLISVIIPVYNSEKTIFRSIESVVASLALCTDDYEIICIDDGSGDDSLEILKKIALENAKVIVIHQENAGAAAARNAGLEIARGEYIAFNDSDDEWSEDHLFVLLETFREYPQASCVSANHDVERQRVYGLKKLGKNIYEVSLAAEQFKNYFSPPNSMISKQIIEFGVRFNPAMKGSEEVFFYNHILKNFKCLFVNKMISGSILHKHRFGENGLSGNLREMEKGELFAIRDAHKNLGVPFFVYILASAFSVLKYFRRIVVVKLRKKKGKIFRSAKSIKESNKYE